MLAIQNCSAWQPLRDPFPNVPTVSYSDFGELLDKICAGSFADVYRVEMPVTGPCAFKQLRQAVDPVVLMKEATSMWQLRHCEHIVRLLKVCTDAGHQGLLLELVEGGSLGDFIHGQKQKLSWDQILHVLHDVASGLECVHDHKHVHLDVKSDNIFLTRGMRAKVGNFGTTKRAQTTLRDTALAFSGILCAAGRSGDVAVFTENRSGVRHLVVWHAHVRNGH